jgi:hypothetical protein
VVNDAAIRRNWLIAGEVSVTRYRLCTGLSTGIGTNPQRGAVGDEAARSDVEDSLVTG